MGLTIKQSPTSKVAKYTPRSRKASETMPDPLGKHVRRKRDDSKAEGPEDGEHAAKDE